jgi:hypothetical protein
VSVFVYSFYSLKCFCIMDCSENFESWNLRTYSTVQGCEKLREWMFKAGIFLLYEETGSTTKIIFGSEFLFLFHQPIEQDNVLLSNLDLWNLFLSFREFSRIFGIILSSVK